MFQVTFSEQSIEELNRLPQMEQMRIVESLSNLNAQALQGNSPLLSLFNREGRTFYRLKAGGYRIYFEIKNAGSTLVALYMLQQHSFKDFLFRFGLPVSDDVMTEEHPSFWKYLTGVSEKNESHSSK